jgi:hypothetical protein
MSDIERRSRADRRRISRNGRRVTDPATPAVDNLHGRPSREEWFCDPAPKPTATRPSAKLASSSIVASDK